MKTVLKIIGGLAVALVVLALGLAAWLVIGAQRPSSPVGFQQARVADPGHPDIPVLIWYPTDSPPRLVLLGNAAASLATNGKLKGTGLPLVVLSHGTGGSGLSHQDTAMALAEAGFVVVSPTHPGDNFRDDRAVGTPHWLVDRARQVHRVTDYMLETWPHHTQLDPSRVGMFGFSAGATTALISLGAEPDLARLAPHCASHPEFVCQLTRPGGTLPGAADWVPEPRIRAAVIAAPGFGFLFGPQGLSKVSAPVQLWLGSRDDRVPLATNAGLIRRGLPVAPEFHSVSGGGHLGFLAPCKLGPPAVCQDPPGFDRRAFHRDFNRQVVAFFHARLAPGLQAQGDHVTVSTPQMTVKVRGDFRATGPHVFSKAEDKGYHFNASLVSFVRPDQAVSVVAERLVEDEALDYSDLSPATWPDHRFLARSRGCASLTPAQAAAMPPETGMAWIRQAGFQPQGSFAFEAALLLAPDHRHEATVELIAPVASCKDPKGIEVALAGLRDRIQVSTP